METVCMFYHLKNGGKPGGVTRGFESVVENLYTHTISIPGCDRNIKDYCEILDCPNKGKMNGSVIQLNAGSFPGECYLKMEEVDLSNDEENEE